MLWWSFHQNIYQVSNIHVHLYKIKYKITIYIHVQRWDNSNKLKTKNYPFQNGSCPDFWKLSLPSYSRLTSISGKPFKQLNILFTFFIFAWHPLSQAKVKKKKKLIIINYLHPLAVRFNNWIYCCCCTYNNNSYYY